MAHITRSGKLARHGDLLVGDDNEWFLLFEEAIRYRQYMRDDISLRIGSSLGNLCQVIPTESHVRLLQKLAVMFGTNGHSLGFNIESIPAERLLGNRLIMEELQYDANAQKIMSLSSSSVERGSV